MRKCIAAKFHSGKGGSSAQAQLTPRMTNKLLPTSHFLSKFVKLSHSWWPFLHSCLFVSSRRRQRNRVFAWGAIGKFPDPDSRYISFCQIHPDVLIGGDK